MTPRLEAALATWRRWQPRPASPPVVLRRLEGGITNDTWLLDTGDGGRVALRLNSVHDKPLAIDRRREYRIHAAAAAAELAPTIHFCSPAAGVLVTDWLQGRELTGADFRAPATVERLRQLVERLQRLELDLPAFDYWGHLYHYRRVIETRGAIVPRTLREATDRHEPAIRRFQTGSWRAVPVHHDFNPGNVIDTHAGLRLIDWEYAALGCGDLDRLHWLPEDQLCDPVLPALRALMDDYWLAVRELLA